MGYDYLWNYVPVPPKYEPFTTANAKAWADELTVEVSRLSEERLQALMAQQWHEDSDEGREEFRQELVESIQAIITGAPEYSPRDIALSTVEGHLIIHTGGLSGGDDPTDSWAALALVAELVEQLSLAD